MKNLLKLKDLMNTKYGNELAKGRHEFFRTVLRAILCRMGWETIDNKRQNFLSLICFVRETGVK